MSTTTKIQNKGQVTIPTRVREQAGLSKGDMVEFSYRGGKIVITPKLVIDRSKFPNADDEYTPAQRRAVDREIAKGLADVKSGRTFGPFKTADEMIAAMKTELKRRAAAKKPKRSR
jgi:AbrB family looped-hinge helix DNA binding protein